MVKTGSVPVTPENRIKELQGVVQHLSKEVQEYIKVEKVMIAAGLVTEAKVEQAHDIVRSFSE